MDLDLLRELAAPNDTKIVLAVIDGLGGLPHPATGRSELETADTPHLDRLAAESSCGLTIPVSIGVTPGSGPGHLALFGYDPLTYKVGRGVLESLGIDFDLQPGDVAARGNFCTLDAEDKIVDRRAGRIPTDESAEICKQLAQIELPGVDLFVEPVRDYRFVLVLRASDRKKLSDQVRDTDPQKEGVKPLSAKAKGPGARSTATLVNAFVDQARELLKGRETANGITLRGFAQQPDLPNMSEVLGLRAAAIAMYPMYRGLAKLIGMTILDAGESFLDGVESLKTHWDDFDFFFIHYKPADAAGEDGDFHAKVTSLEAFDKSVPDLRALGADVLMIAGDHSTPAGLAAHSWHPVPFVLSAANTRPDDARNFDERSCQRGSLGTFPASEVMPLAMAHAGRLAKYGA
ncbi:MAG: 2,3-bisphosphoglycerate-independent phosphoglycerate mutase [Chloroflexi bacterium]|nr:2,3-bisphosphoglycerate-independent phosphoglycerate mutase [Chloroflexota bacterium]